MNSPVSKPGSSPGSGNKPDGARGGSPRRAMTAMLAAAAILLLIVMVAAVWVYGRLHQKIKISPAATFVTGPVRKDGSINYAIDWNRVVGKGVTASNNAAMKILPVLFRTHTAALGKHWRAVQARMGMSGAWPKAPHFKPLGVFFRDRAKTPGVGLKEYYAFWSSHRVALLDHPWAKAQFPAIAAYLTSQRQSLAAIRVAVKLPYLFVAIREHGKRARDLTMMLLRPLGDYVEVAKALDVHATLMLGERHYRRAVADWRTVARLGTLAAQQPLGICSGAGTDLQHLAASAAIAGVVALPRATKLDEALIHARWPKVRNLSRCFGVGERFVALSEFQKLKSGAGPYGGEGHVFFLGRRPPGTSGGLVNRLANWNWLSRRLNVVDTALATAARAPSFAQWVKLAGPTLRMMPGGAHLRAGGPSPTKATYRTIIGIHEGTAARIEFRVFASRTRDGFIRIAAALAMYHAANHRFPARLSALMPRFLKAIPMDAISGKLPKYRRTKAGYRLRSVLPPGNLVDLKGPLVVCKYPNKIADAGVRRGALAVAVR